MSGGELKSISFHGWVTVVECLHVNDYSTKERRATWFSRKEIEKISCQIKKTIKLMESADNKKEVSSEFCTRGLECRTLSGANKRRQNKYAGWFAVEDSQARAAPMTVVADEYSASTKHCVLEAHNRAVCDRQVVLDDILSSTNKSETKDCCSTSKRAKQSPLPPSRRAPLLLSPKAYGPLSPAA